MKAQSPPPTKRRQDLPSVFQLSVFLEERVGQLLGLTRAFDGSEVHILGLSVAYAADAAIVRLVVDRPETANDILTKAGFAVTQTEVAVALLPPGPTGLQEILAALLRAELSILYAYPLFAQEDGFGHPSRALVLRVDELAMAVSALLELGIEVLDQGDLSDGPPAP